MADSTYYNSGNIDSGIFLYARVVSVSTDGDGCQTAVVIPDPGDIEIEIEIPDDVYLPDGVRDPVGSGEKIALHKKPPGNYKPMPGTGVPPAMPNTLIYTIPDVSDDAPRVPLFPSKLIKVKGAYVALTSHDGPLEYEVRKNGDAIITGGAGAGTGVTRGPITTCNETCNVNSYLTIAITDAGNNTGSATVVILTA